MATYYVTGRNRRNHRVSSGPYATAEAAERWANFKGLTAIEIKECAK